MNHIRVAVRIALAMFLLACAMGIATMIYATEKPKIVPPPVVIVEKERDYTAALVGAGVTYWLMRRRAKQRQPEPLVLVPPEPSCPTTEERVERVLELCSK